MGFHHGFGEAGFVDFTHLAVTICMKRSIDLELLKEDGWESRDFSGVILGMMGDMIPYLKAGGSH